MSRFFSKAELDSQCEAYLLQAHDTECHIDDTVKYLRALQSRVPKVDVWMELSDFNKSRKKGVTGPNIKYAFRRFVAGLQGNRCCYCCRWLVNNANAKPIEHILPRESYPQFSLEFWNLAVACCECNLLKKNLNWSTFTTSLADYPLATAFTDFYHPRFHRYGEHVSYDRRETNYVCNVTYTGHTGQGKHLCSEMLYIIASRENFYSHNPPLAEAVSTIQEFQSSLLPGELPALEAFLKCLDDSTQSQLDDSGVDNAPLKG